MRRSVITVLIVVLLAAPLAWQVVSSEIANSELQEDLRDLASENAARLGLSPANTDDDFRSRVIEKAKEHGIRLEPDQVTVERTGSEDAPAVNLSVDYKTAIGFSGLGFPLHFNPRAQGKPLVPLREAR